MEDKELKALIESVVKGVISERVSPVVFHFCSYSSCLGICQRNEFVLSHVMRGTADGDVNRDKHYLSLTRQKTNTIGYSQNKDVRITLNGDKLNQRYKGGPVDYWGTSMGKQWYMQQGALTGHYDPHQSRTENEDRVFSKDPVIPNANEYIMRIDILLKPDRKGEYNPYYIQCIQEILKTGFQKIVFVYGDDNSFNMQNDNIINEQVRTMDAGKYIEDVPYQGSIKIALLDLFNAMFSYEYDRQKMWSQCYKKLREYGISRYIIQQYGPDFLKCLEDELPRRSWNIDDMLANTQNMIDSLRNYDKTLYVRTMRMFNDYLTERNLFGLRDLYNYKQKLVKSYGNRVRGYVGLDWNKTFNCLALVDLNYEEGSDYVSGAIVIPNPDTTSIWKVIPDERRYFVDDIMNQNPSHNSRNDEYFRKYLQHIARQEMSVTAFIDFLNKLQVPNETKQEILMYKKFGTITLKAYNYDHARYVSPEDKQQVEQALAYDQEQPQ